MIHIESFTKIAIKVIAIDIIIRMQISVSISLITVRIK